MMTSNAVQSTLASLQTAGVTRAPSSLRADAARRSSGTRVANPLDVTKAICTRPNLAGLQWLSERATHYDVLLLVDDVEQELSHARILALPEPCDGALPQ